MQIKNKQIILTENNNCIITYKIKQFEVITTNYYENSILCSIFNCDSNIQAIFILNTQTQTYNILQNITLNNTQIQQIIKQLIQQMQQVQ